MQTFIFIDAFYEDRLARANCNAWREDRLQAASCLLKSEERGLATPCLSMMGKLQRMAGMSNDGAQYHNARRQWPRSEQEYDRAHEARQTYKQANMENTGWTSPILISLNHWGLA